MYVMIKGNIGQFCGLVEIIVGDFFKGTEASWEGGGPPFIQALGHQGQF